MEKKSNKKIVGILVAVAVVLGVAGIASQVNNNTEEKTVETSKKEETKTIGEKTKDSTKITVNNRTNKDITVVETRSSSDEGYSDNLLTDGDVFANMEKRVLYATVKNDDTLNLKIGFKDEEESYSFENIDTSDIKKADIKLDENNDVVINVYNKDNTITETIKPVDTEKKSDEEKKNEEEAKEEKKEESTSKNESSNTGSNASAGTNTNTNKNNNTSASSSSAASSNTGSASSSNTNGSSSSTKQSHTHNWVPQYKTVHHDAVYEQKYVVDQEAYTQELEICNQCGTDITGNASAHNKAHALAGESGGWHAEFVTVPEQGHYENVLVSAAYDEQVLTGYQCSTCGATK